MAGTSTAIFPQTVKTFVAQILPADTTTKKTLVTGGTNGTKIEALMLTSTDTTSRDVQFWMTSGGTDYLLCTISAILSSGNTNSAATIDVLRHAMFQGLSYDSNGNKILYVASGCVLKVACLTTVTAAKEIDIVGCGGDF